MTAEQSNEILDLELFGFRVNPVTIERLVEHISEHWHNREKTSIFYQNLHTFHLQNNDPGLARTYDDTIACVDGLPIIWALRAAGHDVVDEQRLTAIDMLGPILEAAAAEQRRVFVIGQHDMVLAAALDEIRSRYPSLQIDGHHGFFDREGPESEQVIGEANSYNADLVLVGLGTPIAEYWVDANRDRFDAPVVWLCGALMEYIGGDVPSPPRWAGPMGMEWAFRLAADPTRFVGRYILEPPVLATQTAIRQLSQGHQPDTAPANLADASTVPADHVALCIATYRRPEGLAKLLDAIAELDWDKQLTVIVADNDPEGQDGIQVCNNLPDSYPWNIKTVVVEESGIPFPRNAAVEIALAEGADCLAFLDDDEQPKPDWLGQLTRVLELGADLAGGPQLPVFPEGTPDKFKTNDYYGHDQLLPDGEPCILQSSGNFIVRAAALAPLGPPWFDPAYARTSGADHDLFLRLDTAGAVMRWAPDAGVAEDIPETRLNDKWMRERVTEIHNGRVRIDTEHAPDQRSNVVRLAKTAGLGVHAVGLTLAGLRDEDTAYRAQLLRWKFLGKATAHAGSARHREEDR